MNRTLRDFLKRRRSDILTDWIDRTFATYPRESVSLLRAKTNRFSNPIGETIRSGLARLYDAFVADSHRDDPATLVGDMVRLRAVQDFTPARAVAFLTFLKASVRESLHSEPDKTVGVEDLGGLEEAVDTILLCAMDVYVECREQLYRIRAGEARARSSKLIERANRIIEQHAEGQSIDMTQIDNVDRQGGGGQ
jgi:hypothetical protein